MEMVTTDKAVAELGRDIRTIRRWIKEKKIKFEYVTGQGRGGQTLLVDIESCKQFLDKSFKVTFLNDKESDTEQSDIQQSDIVPFQSDLCIETPQSTINDTIFGDTISEYARETAMLKASLLTIIIDELRIAKNATKCWRDIINRYNTGQLVPTLLARWGKREYRTLRGLLTIYEDSKCNYEVLIKKEKRATGHAVTEDEKNFLLSLLLKDNHIKIETAINQLKHTAATSDLHSPTHERTLRRWVEEYKKENPLIWHLSRDGEKYVKDKLLPSIIRDARQLNVGDVLIADGHTLAFDIIDPVSGKPRRMTFIVFYDWASRMPVGATIANTENSAHILLALRNAILNLGRICGFGNDGCIPLAVYLDNGKAFKSKLFHGNWDKHDIEVEMTGIYERLGIEVSFAWPYNARSKPVERYFSTFQEGFERFQDTFRGSNIIDKPAWLQRNETFARKIRNHQPVEYTEALQMVNYYVHEVYGTNPHSGIAKKRPIDVLNSFRADASRRIDREQLHFLMLKSEQRTITKEGIRLNNILYHHDKLINRVTQPVIVRYDLCDVRSIMVYDAKDRPLCPAIARESVHPFVKLAKDRPTSENELKKQIEKQRKTLKIIKDATKSEIKKVNHGVDELLSSVTMNEKLPENHNPDQSIFSDIPLLEQHIAPPPNPDYDNMIAEFEKQENTLEKSPHIYGGGMGGDNPTQPETEEDDDSLYNIIDIWKVAGI